MLRFPTNTMARVHPHNQPVNRGAHDPAGNNFARRARGTAVLLACVLGYGTLGTAVFGCHASPDDPAGQAKELSDPVRRRNAIANIQRLYSNALAAADGDRNHEGVKKIVDVTAEPLAQAYVKHPEDVGAGEEMLALLEEMRDLRALPAAQKALSWRPGTEPHAVRAAKIIRRIDIPPGEVKKTADALGAAVTKVRQSKPDDNRLRREAILALGKLADPSAHPHLIKIMERQAEHQDFLFNRLAAQQYAETVTDPDAVPVLIRALFAFDGARPQIQLEDVARSGLVRLGPAAVGPLLALLKGQNAEAKAQAQAFVTALEAMGIGGFSADRLLKERAAATLGDIGAQTAYAPLLAIAQNKEAEPTVRWEAACALAKFDVAAEAPRGTRRQVMKDVFLASPLEHRPRLIHAMKRSYDPGFLPFLLDIAKNRETHPDLRLLSASVVAQVANKAEAKAVRGLIASEPTGEEGGYKHKFKEHEPLLDLAEACDRDVSCWTKKLAEGDDPNALMKAASMLARLGRGNGASLEALVKRLDFPHVGVRVAVLRAIDRVATEGSPEALAVLERLEVAEESTKIWNDFAQQALVTRARLAARGG